MELKKEILKDVERTYVNASPPRGLPHRPTDFLILVTSGIPTCKPS